MAKRQGYDRGEADGVGRGEGAEQRDQPDREDVRRRRDHEAGRGVAHGGRGDLDRGPLARPGARRQGVAAGADHRAVRPGVERQDDDRAARGGQRPARRRRRGVHRRRARARPVLVQAARRGHRVAPGQPARQRRGGPADRRDAGAVQRGGHHRHRLGGRAGPQGRDRGRDRRQLRRRPGPADEPGPAQADRRRLAVEVRPDLHQPDPREDRRDVRQPRDDAGRPGPEVLQLVPDRRPPDRAGQGRRGSRRLADQGQGRQEQGRARRSASASST